MLQNKLEGTNNKDQKIDSNIRNTLRNVIRVILSSPTTNKKTFNMKKKFLADSPNIMFKSELF